MNWDINEHWDASLGGRLESWNSRDGYYWANDETTPESNLARWEVPGQDQDKFSPKFALGYKPVDQWVVRYSLAKAYRFPITEELFSRYQAFNQATQPDPGLQPEDGVHQNFLLERGLDGGYLRMNLFHETIEDVIENQTNTITSVTTFFPIDEVETRGIEWIANIHDFVVDKFDMRFNMVYTDSEIVKNSANPELKGKVPPRMPEWRGNLLATYHISDAWDVGGNVQYASDSFGRADNRDTRDHVYGAQDAYTRLGIKTSYSFDRFKASFGVDNLTDELSYVAHPWPARTFYVTVNYDL